MRFSGVALAPVADGLTWHGLADVEQFTGRSTAALKRWRGSSSSGPTTGTTPCRIATASLADEAVIFRRFGKTPVSRWKAAKRLYRAAGLDARFKLYRASRTRSPEMERTSRSFRSAPLGPLTALSPLRRRGDCQWPAPRSSDSTGSSITRPTASSRRSVGSAVVTRSGE